MTRSTFRLALGAGLAALCLAGLAAPSLASAATKHKPAEPDTIDPRGPAAADAQLSALAPANLKKPRAKPPFNLTGTWFVDLSKGPASTSCWAAGRNFG